MNLIKEAVTLLEGPEPKNGNDLAKILTKELKGKKIQAFGPKGKGLWGTAKEEKTYKISKITCTYSNEEGTFISLDVYLTGYHVDHHGLVYTDKTFIKQLKEMVKASSVNHFIKNLDYSEQGMQGEDFINLDVTTKFAKAIKEEMKLDIKHGTIGSKHDPYSSEERIVRKDRKIISLYTDGLGSMHVKVDGKIVVKGHDGDGKTDVHDKFKELTGFTEKSFDKAYHRVHSHDDFNDPMGSPSMYEGLPSEMEVHLHKDGSVKKFGKEKASHANMRAHGLCNKHSAKLEHDGNIIHVRCDESKDRTPNDHGVHADKLVTVQEVYNMISKKSFDAWYKRELEKHREGETDTKDIIDDLAKMLGKADYS